MSLYLYDANAETCVTYPNTDLGFIQAVNDGRRYGGFIRDTSRDLQTAGEVLSYAETVVDALLALNTPNDEAHDRIIVSCIDAVNAADRDDFPSANVRILYAQNILNALYAEVMEGSE